MAIAELAVNLVANTGNFVKNINKVSREIDKTGKLMQGAGKSLMSLTAPLIALGGAASKTSMDFNKSMSAVEVMISRVASEGGKDIHQLKEAVLELSSQTGISTTEMSEGLFQVISTFGNTADAMNQLEVASKAALAGGATVSETISLLGVVSKNFGDTSAEAQQKIIDLAFVTNELGVTNFRELASSMTAVTPIAANMGVSMEELFASYSALTGVTGNTSEVTTQLAAALGSLQKPTSDMRKIFAELGVETGDELIRQEGLLKAFQLVEKEQQKLGVTMAQVMGRKEGLNFVTGLLTSQTEKYTQALEINASAAGTGLKAYETYTQGINKSDFTMNKLIQTVKAMSIQFGDELAPVLLDVVENGLVPVLNSLQGLLSWFKQLEPSTKKWIVSLTLGTAAVGAFLVVVGKALTAIAGLTKLKILLVPAIKGVTLAFTGLKIVILALGGPITIAIAAIAALAAGIYYFWDEIKVAIDWLKKFAIEIGDKLKQASDTAIRSVKLMMDGVWDTITGGFRRVLNFVGDATGRVTGFFNDMYIAVVGNSIVPDMADEVIVEFKRMNAGMIEVTGDGTRAVVTEFNNLAFSINKILDSVLGSSSGFVNDLMRNIHPQGLGGLFNDFFGKELSSAFSEMGKLAANEFSSSFNLDLGKEMGEVLGGAISGGIWSAMSWWAGEIISGVVKMGESLFSDGKSPRGSDLSTTERGTLAVTTFGFSEMYFAAERYARKWWGSGTSNPATIARRAFERELNNLIDGKNIRIFDENGVLVEIDKISMGAKQRFNGNWAESFHQLTGDASSAFLGVGYALQHLMGITEDIGGQMAYILADNLGGSIENLALLLMGLDIPIQDMEAAMVQAFMNGSISAHDFSVFMQGLHQGYAELERAQEDLGLAIQLWLGSGGKGETAVRSFQAVANAAMSQGIKTVEDFISQAVAQGLLTAEQADQVLRAFAAHGITSMDQIANASDAMLIHILGSLETMEKEGENSFFGVAERVNENFQNIEDRWERIRRLPTAVLNIEMKVGGDRVPEQVSSEMRPVQGRQTSVTVPALDTGGIVANPTLALIGERRKEAVIPLDELPSMMEDIMSRAGSVSEKAMGAVFHIDARGAMRGVGEEIKNALINFVDVRNGLLGTT